MRVPERAHSSDDETNEPSDRGDDDMHCRACGHDHAPGTTCGVCGHHREKCDRKANGVAECAARRRGDPIIEVIDKFLCLGAFEHTCREEVLLACGIRTAVPSCSPCCSSRNIDVFTVPTCAEDGLKVDLLETVKKLDALHARSRRADEAGVPRRVLVYCMSGQSRAPSVAVAYLMYSERRGVEDAIKSLNRRYPRGHPGVRLKPADTESLREFETQLYAAARADEGRREGPGGA